MTVDFTIKENSNVRIRKRRRKLESGRRSKTVRMIRIPAVIIIMCLLTGLIGYIESSDGDTGSTGLLFSAHAEENVVYKEIVVKKGDTLWAIASEFAEPSIDIRMLINDICKLNDIKPGSIYPGQVISVPVPAHLYQ